MNLTDWQHKESVSLFASDGENEVEYRLTFKTMSALDEAKYQRAMRKARTLIDEVYGKPDDRSEDDQADAEALMTILIEHAAIMAALDTVEVKDEDGDWEDARLPEEWYDGQAFATSAPAGLINELFVAVSAAGNFPLMFGFTPATDDEKKALRLTVRRSTS